MPKKRIAIIGSGIAGTTIAYLLTQKGHQVDIFEKGPEYIYPHYPQFEETELMLQPEPSSYQAPPDLKNHSLSGAYSKPIEGERHMHAGGSATHWEAIALRMRPNDFRRKTKFSYGEDWPITYKQLERFYTQAEWFLGVSGTADDNPFSPRRSKGYPLPAFPLSHDDKILAKRLQAHNLVLHTTPQARASKPYDGRSQCTNFRACRHCPVGARYSPNHHLGKTLKSDLATLHTNVSVRRIVADSSGKVRGVVYRQNDESLDKEHEADLVVLAAGGLESPRLLLLSKDTSHPDGLGNTGGHVGRHLAFHHIWRGDLRFKERLLPGRFGGWTGQCDQFLDPEEKGKYAGTKIEFSSNALDPVDRSDTWTSTDQVLESLNYIPYTRPIAFHTESVTSDDKYLKLSEDKDRFGDPFVHIHYASDPFDIASFQHIKTLCKRFAKAANAQHMKLAGEKENAEDFDNGCHHMGTCRMGASEKDSVVDSYGQVHDTKNLFVAGSSIFVGTSGAVDPTLTIVALAMRTADYLIDKLGDV